MLSTGQIARVHGAKSGQEGWKRAGYTMKPKPALTPELARLLLRYGELAQTTYDRLGNNRTRPGTWGHPTTEAPKLLGHLTAAYSQPPGATTPPVPGSGTGDVYRLPPASDALSPLIYAQPGAVVNRQRLYSGAPAGSKPAASSAAAGGAAGAASGSAMPLAGAVRGVQDWFVGLLSPGIAKIADSTGPLFTDDPATGRPEERSGFMGYVAVDESADVAAAPAGAGTAGGAGDESGAGGGAGAGGGGADVALVWRGTVFLEEWQRNFQDDTMVKWPGQREPGQPGPDVDALPAANPWDVGVHAGFCKLYLKPAQQPGETLHPDGPDKPIKLRGEKMPPREAVHAWLAKLLSGRRVATVTVTGHSLGAALATVCAYDVAEALADWDAFKRRSVAAGLVEQSVEWATAEAPKVTAITWAPPRSGNFFYASKLAERARVLRICNLGDVVPRVPGLWPQLLTTFFKMFRVNLYQDMESPQARVFGWTYVAISVVLSVLWPSRWGYFHAGQILELDSDTGLDYIDGSGRRFVVGEANGGSKHNLEVYLYLLSRFGGVPRNRLLMNKGADILWLPREAQAGKAAPAAPAGDDGQPPAYPAKWWQDPAARGVEVDADGRWQLVKGRWPDGVL